VRQGPLEVSLEVFPAAFWRDQVTATGASPSDLPYSLAAAERGDLAAVGAHQEVEGVTPGYGASDGHAARQRPALSREMGEGLPRPSPGGLAQAMIQTRRRDAPTARRARLSVPPP
jgi:hypothetical protein